MATGTFVTAINCMDGRTQVPVNDWMKASFDADYVDTITEPGPDGILSDRNHSLVTSIKDRVLISVQKHHSEVVAIVAHGDCAGNPVSKDEHLIMLRRAVDTIAGWKLNVTVVGLWLEETDWQVQEVYRTIG
ncbi:MAG: carbonic anhydrase [bacterium]